MDTTQAHPRPQMAGALIRLPAIAAGVRLGSTEAALLAFAAAVPPASGLRAEADTLLARLGLQPHQRAKARAVAMALGRTSSSAI